MWPKSRVQKISMEKNKKAAKVWKAKVTSRGVRNMDPEPRVGGGGCPAKGQKKNCGLPNLMVEVVADVPRPPQREFKMC